MSKAGLQNTQKTRNPDFTPMILSFSWPKDAEKALKGSSKDMETRLDIATIRQDIAIIRQDIVIIR